MRRLRLNRQSDNPQSAIRVVLDASMEVRSAVLYGSLIVVGSRSRETAVPGTSEFLTARLINRGEGVFGNGFE